MKKLKNILLMSAMTVCSLAFANAVNAASFTMPNMNLVCEPNAIEAGGQTTCYIIGQPEPNKDDTRSVHGYVAQAYTSSKYTEIVVAKSNTNIPNTGAVFTKEFETTSKPFAQETVPAAIKNFNCAFDSTISSKKGEGDFACAVFFSTGSTNVYTPLSLQKNADKILNAQDAQDGYGIIGSLVVRLKDDAVINQCGELCVKVWRVPDERAYADYKKCALATPGDETCGDTTGVEGTDYFCKEIHLKGTTVQPSPPTGAFASYAILAAGALIAISAVTMAKKNNKFNRI
ncbi:MAG: hypothetical protein K2H20_00080 [Bacilli bacterium]|nr:hypothetical protein [Bacilli bacterium]